MSQIRFEIFEVSSQKYFLRKIFFGQNMDFCISVLFPPKKWVGSNIGTVKNVYGMMRRSLWKTHLLSSKMYFSKLFQMAFFLHFAVVVFLLHAEKSLLSFEDSHLAKTDKERKCRQYTLAKNLEKKVHF